MLDRLQFEIKCLKRVEHSISQTALGQKQLPNGLIVCSSLCMRLVAFWGRLPPGKFNGKPKEQDFKYRLECENLFANI